MKGRYSHLSNDELLELVKKRYKELNATPKCKDMKNEFGCPTIDIYYKRFNTKSWNDILKLCDIPFNTIAFYTDNEGLNKLKELYNILNRLPTQKDFKKYNWSPNHTWYCKRFGDINKAVYLAGLIEEYLTKDELIQISIKEFINIGIELNRCPTRKEYNKNRTKGVNFETMSKFLNLNLNDICRIYLTQFKLNSFYDVSNEQIKEDIILLKQKLNRIPMYTDLKKNNIYYSERMFKTRFGSFNKFIENMGWKPHLKHGVHLSDDDLLDYFYNKFLELKKIPTFSDLKDCSYTYSKRFGSIGNICSLLNIDFNSYLSNGKIGKLSYDKNGELCRSIPEKNITNFFIDNNIIYEKEYSYSNLIPNNKKILDWKITINDKIYYLEYFGLYQANNKNKKSKNNIYTKKAKKKIKTLYKYGYIDRCIFLYPNDYFKERIHLIFEKLLNKTLNIESLYQKNDVQYLHYDNLIETVMKYSDDLRYLPSYNIFKENKLWSLYNQIIREYGSYEKFGKVFNKINRKHINNKSLWDKQMLFDQYDNMIQNYGKILSIKELKNKNLYIKGYENFQSKNGGSVKLKLEYLYIYVKKNNNLPKEEKIILDKMHKRIFPYGFFQEEIYEMVNKIFNKLNNKVGDEHELLLSYSNP